MRKQFLSPFVSKIFLRIIAISALSLLMLASLWGNFSTNAEEEVTEDRHVVLVLTGDITWADIQEYPESSIARLAPYAQTANLLPREQASVCPYNLWFFLSAGRATPQVAQDSGCFDAEVEGGEQLPEANIYFDAFANGGSTVGIGALAKALKDGGVAAAAIGTGAAVVLADENLTVPDAYEVAPQDDAELADIVARNASDYRLTVVDADRRTVPVTTTPELENTEANIARLDAILDKMPSNVRVLVIAANPGMTDAGLPMPVLFLSADLKDAPNPILKPSLVESSGIRQQGLVQLSSIDPTLLEWFGIEIPDGMPDSVLVPGGQQCDADSGCESSVEKLVSDARHMELSWRYYMLFWNNYLYVLYAFLLVTAVLLIGPIYRITLRFSLLSLLWQWVSLTVALVPFASLIVNGLSWWDSSRPLFTVAIEIGSIASVMAVVSLLIGRRHVHLPMLFAATLTAFAYLVDVVRGSNLLANSFFGFLFVGRGRFYGMGNEAFSLVFVGLCIFLAYLGVFLMKRNPPKHFKNPWFAVVLVGIIGLLAILIEGAPGFGADFGGLISLFPVLVVELFLIGRFRISFTKVFAALLAVSTLIGVVSVIDWMRPVSQRTHLGGFVQKILDGTAWSQSIVPKLHANISILTHDHRSVFFILVVLVFIFLILRFALWVSPRKNETHTFYPWSWLAPSVSENRASLLSRSRELRITLISIGIACILGSTLNDTGIGIMSIAFGFFLPLLIVTVLRDQKERHDYLTLSRAHSGESKEELSSTPF